MQGQPMISPAGPRPIVRCSQDTGPEWLADRREQFVALLAEHGSVLVRGLGVSSVAEATRISSAIISSFVTEKEGFAPRDRYAEGVYSSAKWPADQPMCMHHELSYARTVPRLLVLSCLCAPARGGATLLADSRRVLAELPAELVEPLSLHGWRLDRNYNSLVGTPWPDAFGTNDRSAVEQYCQDNDIAFRWGHGDVLHTEQVRPAITQHPLTGERCWFNQVAFLNEWTLDEAVREYLTTALGDGVGIPFNTYVGDGRPITRGTVDTINAAYERHTVREPWQSGDVLIIDNVLTAHGLEPYEGPREVVVAMGDPIQVTA